MPVDTETGERGNQNVTELEKVQKDLLWNEYTELRTHQRHTETVRTSALSVVLLITSALTTVVTVDKAINRAALPLCLIITAVGLFSIPFSLLYVHRYG